LKISLLALLVVGVLVSLPPAARASGRKCGSVSYTFPGTSGNGHAALNNLTAHDISCRIARTVAKTFLEHHAPPKGWHVASKIVKRNHDTLSERIFTRGSARVVGDLAN
jgi:hypothetical protein